MKKKPDANGFVYSTDPDYKNPFAAFFQSVDLEPDKQKLLVKFEKKGRGGKQVTLISGFVGTDESLEKLAKVLKTKLGVGGSAKDGEIVIQGDHRTKAVEILNAEGYSAKAGN